MIRVLIAEDEIPLLKGIRIMLEQLEPELSVVKCAHNGKEAIEYLKEQPVDVLFTDINMPLVSGIDVMKFAAEKYPDCARVVISGYDDFKYAQQAIQYGAKAYLLKPIVQEELRQIVSGISREFKENRIRKQEDMLKDVVYTRKKTEGKEKLQILYLCAGPLIKEDMEEEVAECEFWKDVQLENMAVGMLPERTGIYVFEKYQPNERIMLLVPNEEIDLRTFARKLTKALGERGITATAAYHQEMIEIPQIQSVSYQLRRHIREGILFGESSILSDTGEENAAQQEPDRKFYVPGSGAAREKKDIVLKEAKNFCSKGKLRQKECIALLEQILENFDENAGQHRAKIEETVWNLILYSHNAEQLFGSLYQMLDERGISTKQESTQDLMKKVELYVKEHMSEPVTAAFLAGRFGLVAPYLSRLFKEYSGYTVSQYIQKIRLERAKRLLEMDEEILAKDVAEMVGYPNPLYFSKIFKKKIGVYPSEYRKIKIKEKMMKKPGGKNEV